MQCPNCRAAVPAGSRFCNGCGAAIPAAAPPPGQRTQSYQPPVAPARPPGAYGERTQAGHANGAHPGGYGPPNGTYPPQGGYPPQGAYPPAGGYAPAPAPEPAQKRPVALLLLALVLLLGGVAAAGVVLLQRGRGSVVGASVTKAPAMPGVQVGVNPGMPQAPNPVAGVGTAVPPAPPVVGSRQQPNDMAPPVIAAPGSRPGGAPSVVVSRGIPEPPRPNVVASPGSANPGPNPMLANRSPMPVGPNPTAQQKPAEPDNSDLDRYLEWLRFVENERQVLRQEGLGHAMENMPNFSGMGLAGLLETDASDQQIAQQYQQQMNRVLATYTVAIRNFQANIYNSRRRLRLVVPPDCMELDRNYMNAVMAEAQFVPLVLQASQQGIADAMAGRGQGSLARLMGLQARMKNTIYPPLKAAERQLQGVYRRRSYPEEKQVQIDAESLTGGGMGSGLGGMLGGLFGR